MALPALLDDQGKRVTLGPELGRGGEAAVYSVEGRPDLVAKIYHQPPDAEKAAKLLQMVRSQSEPLLAFSAWPVATLFSPSTFSPSTKAVVGFLMKNVSRYKDIHLLYSPKSRTREFPPKANWRFLIHTASNVARAFAAVHDFGHVIGDVNQSNVRVSPESAVVNLIDCDSFQISAGGKIYLCTVGVPLYTPPELQDMEFREVVRTPNHDNFGLAVLIFHLLFMGRHPFAGRFSGRSEMPLEKAIAEYRFAFARDTQRTQMSPPPASITLAHLPEEIGNLFIQAFNAEGAAGNRPTGRQWITALDALANHLIVCSSNKAHLFFNKVPACPWCPIEASGVLLFVEYAFVGSTTGFSIELIWARILAVPNPGFGNTPSLVKYMSTVAPSPRAKAMARKRLYKIAAFAIAAVAALTFIVLSPTGIDYLFWIIFGLTSLIRYVFNNSDAPKEFAHAARAAEARLRNLQQSWKLEASGKEFAAKLEEMRSLTGEYRNLAELRKQKIRELERALYDIQLRRYLEKFSVASADIPHVKDGRKAMLAAYGINDAADVTPQALEAVPGFGPLLVTQVLIWRQSLQTRFKFNPGRGLDPSDLMRVDREVSKRRGELELLLSNAPFELSAMRGRILAARTRLHDQLEQALHDVAQAQADEVGAT